MLPHCKCVLWCCAKFPSIHLPEQETDYQYLKTSPSIHFHIYYLISRCTKPDRLPLTDKKSCHKCQQYTPSGQSTKIYTRKELVMMETPISNFHTSFYIPSIQRLAFRITHVQILVTNNCGDSRRNAFKSRKSVQDVLFRHDYAEGVVASFAHQIQS